MVSTTSISSILSLPNLTITKSQAGLSNVDNYSSTTLAVLSATKFTTARTINGISFDGTANITVADATVTASSTKWDTAYSLTNAGHTNWDTAYGWGNHAGLYLTLAASTSLDYVHAESDPVWTADKASYLTTSGNGGSLTGLTKTQVGLTNVDNYSSTTLAVLSATKFTTARTINGISFDGTANITVADATVT
ncbi:MAG: hypothetical protein NT041_01930, partial [Candidatus Vogelbacteria bacterium]|nr:hypothetical protein [Candidatus Vogelbacteria bacterium]